MLEMLTVDSETFQSFEKPLVILLIGPPGAGKGTHAGPLSQHLQLPHISTGDLFRENIKNQTPLGKRVKEYIDQGKLGPDELVFDMLFDRIAKPDCKNGYILDGFPRTVAQAEVFESRLGDLNRLIALNFQVPDSALVERITGRLTCKECSRPYHKKFDPPPVSYQCEACGGLLYQREDDRAEVVIKRLEVYHQQTEPILAFLAQKEGVLRDINALLSKEKVYQQVLESLSTPVAAAP